MGRGYIEYNLPDTRRCEWVLFSAFIDYRLDDGSKLHVEQAPAWCRSCRAFVVAESLQSIEELERAMGELQAGQTERLQLLAFIGKTVEEAMTELQKRLQWRRSRCIPPRCLHCGSVAIVPIPWSGEFAHPETGEQVVTGDSGFADTAPWFADFSPEGDQLA
jgi:hypothetical protein